MSRKQDKEESIKIDNTVYYFKEHSQSFRENAECLHELRRIIMRKNNELKMLLIARDELKTRAVKLLNSDEVFELPDTLRFEE